MIDPFVMQSLLADPPLRPMASAMVERSFDYAEVATVEREAEAHLQELRQQFDGWLQRSEDVVKKLALSEATDGASSGQLGQFDGLVDFIDGKALEFAVKAKRAHRNNERSLKTSVGLSADRKSMLKRVLAKARKQDQDFLQGFLDLAALARIARANVAPDAGSGMNFDKAEDLERYLASVGA